MLEEATVEKAGKLNLRMRLVWVGHWGSLGLYVFIAHQAVSGGMAEPEKVPLLPIIFSVMGLGSLLAGIALSWFLFSERRKKPLMKGLKAGATAGEDGSLGAILAETFQLYLMSEGLIDTCAIMAMVLAVMTHSVDVAIPLGVAAAVGHLLCFPRVTSFVDNWHRNQV